MKIKSARYFRFWYKTKVKEIEENSLSHNENFVGTYHTENGKKIKGFFEMYHGDKPDIAAYLPSILKIAEDGQAIYEFLQNAVDCNSTHFYIFYNEKYFLAINNGEPFDIEGLQSVLNIAQTTKKSCDKIGRFGIGFKLVHRLVGKNEGVSELVAQYKGPILFSWAKLQDLRGLMGRESIEPLYPDKENDQAFSDAPYLLKLILTNFPADPNETVKDLGYRDRVVFSQNELNEMIDFLNNSFNKHANSIYFNDLAKGSIFFLCLGEGKKEMLDKDYEDLKKGVQYSMNTLKKLRTVYLNNEFIEKQALELEEFEIDKNSERFAWINPEYKECNIKITFGYYRNYKQSEKIKDSPNFYKYFPMGDEANGFSFILHCDSFSNEANRRKLQKDITNKNLLLVIADLIIIRLNEYKINNRERFLRLYACLLLSDVPDKQNNEWLKPIFYDVLLKYLCNNIPTQNNQFSEKPENVKINKLNIRFNLADFGLDHVQWFEWEIKNDSDLLKEARNKEKLALEIWDLEDLILNGLKAKINSWLQSISQERFDEFVSELRNISDTSWNRNGGKLFRKFCELKYFMFSDGNYFSIDEHTKISNLVILTPPLYEIKDILLNLGFIVSVRVVTIGDGASSLAKLIHSEVSYLKNEINLFEKISLTLSKNNLNTNQKQRLFSFFENLRGVGPEKLRSLALFCNNKGEVKPLCELVDSALSTPTWINSFKIKAEENFGELKEYLISEKKMYQEVILPNWNDIISEVINVAEFYSKIKFYYDQDEKNTPLKKQAFVFVNKDEGFVPASNVFYNYKFLQISSYQDFQNAVHSLTDAQTPQKEILKYLNDAPFKLENVNLFDYSINDDTELDLREIEAVLAFCKSNNESFFGNCVVEKQEQSFIVSEKSSNVYQIRPPKKEIRQFIEDNFDDMFKILPYELDEYKDEVGIIQGEKLYDIIVSEVDVEEFKEELLNILAYDEPKRKFVLQLSEIRLVSGEEYDKASFEFKILKLACDVLKNKEDIVKFKDKVIIETDEQDLTLSEIPPFADQVKIENYELSLANILPNTYRNSDHLSSLIQHFGSIGIDRNKLNSLFGINQEPEISDIFKLFSEETTTLENAQQLAFLILYNEYIESVDLSSFKVETLSDEYDLHEYSYYTRAYPFLLAGATLNEKYKGIEKIFQNFPIPINSEKETFLLKKPFFLDEKFICPDIDEEMSDEQKLSFIEFLFNQWDKKNKKKAIRNINWAKINEIETAKLLGFDPNYSVYPSKYALESEKLPEYLQEWLGEYNAKINFIADLGVFTEDSTLLSLRKFFNNEDTFNKSKITQDSRLADEKMLFNTFEWLRENEFELSNGEAFEVFEEMVRVINSNRAKGQELIIQNEYDFELLESEAIEWETPYYENWREELEDKFSIYLFEGALPKIIKLDEIDDYVFYRYNQDDIVINEDNNIFINRNADIKKALSSLISDDDNEFSMEDLLLLYQTEETVNVKVENDEVAKLLSEVERLRKRIAELEGVSGRASYNATVSFDDDYHNEIKEKSEKYLFGVLKKIYREDTVVWLNYNEATNSFKESWQNHDFEIHNRSGEVLHYIDCKGTSQQKETFYLTSNEWSFFLDCVQNGKSYQIYRVFNVEGNTEYKCIDNLWEWIKAGKVVPYLVATETIKGGRVFLTLK